jgi:uracil-DNA glycosylase family 4
MTHPVYDASCRQCPRLASFIDQVKAKHGQYFCRPVPPFGPERAGLLVVGLAPGLHGANATGRPFTGDACSDLLYGSLYAQGFASRARSVSADDGLVMVNCRITNAVKCLPPDNKPIGSEVNNCRPFLAAEIQAVAPRVILCLGSVAHAAVVRSLPLMQFGKKPKDLVFGHAAEHSFGRMVVLDSYHPSRYNVNTGRLTEAMFLDVIGRARQLVDQAHVNEGQG